jgi:hypothetical protein
VGSNPAGGHGCLSLVSVVCCQVEVSATGWSLVQRSPTDCGVSQKCVIVKPRKIGRPRPPRGCRAIEKRKRKKRIRRWIGLYACLKMMGKRKLLSLPITACLCPTNPFTHPAMPTTISNFSSYFLNLVIFLALESSCDSLTGNL